MKNLFYFLSIAFLLQSCGSAVTTDEVTETDTTAVVVVEEVADTTVVLAVDTTAVVAE